MTHEADALAADALLVHLVSGGFKGPVNEHGPANDVLARNEAPETEPANSRAVSPMAKPCREERRVAIDDVVREVDWPICAVA